MADTFMRAMPDYFVLIKENEGSVTGYVNNDGELKGAMEAFERTSMASFVNWSHRTNPKDRLVWNDDGATLTPCLVKESTIKLCSYGGQPGKRRKPHQKEDHEYVCGKLRFHMQGSRKVGCEAKLHIKTMILFAKDHQVCKKECRVVKEAHFKVLKNKLENGTADGQTRIMIEFPKADSHTNHSVTIESGFSHRIHPAVRDKIYDLVSMGFVTVPLVRKMLRDYVRIELCASCEVKPLAHDQSYFPKASVINRHIHAALVTGRYTDVDQDNVEIMMNDIDKQSPGQHTFFLRKCGTGTQAPANPSTAKDVVFSTHPEEDEEEDNEKDGPERETSDSGTFLFVHQTNQQRRLLDRYGNMAFLDATYKTSKYALPLFLLVVKTNVNYMPVAEFIIESETRSNIQEALDMIKAWNPAWNPHSFMLDYSDEEYQALEAVFPAARKYLCSFHREQAWHRWMKNRKNNVHEGSRENLLQLLRALASSRSAEEFAQAAGELKASGLYQRNPKLQQYLNRYWFAIPERWCALHAGMGFEGLVTTNNGVESLNHTLKASLKVSGKSNGTLSCLVKTMVETFLHNLWIRYVQMNYDASSQSRPYIAQIPDYLHNRPKEVVEKCMKAHAAAVYCHPQQIQEKTKGQFLIQSEGKRTTYTVNLGGDAFPHCSCPHFRDNLLPCKHIFALFCNGYARWDDLPSAYRDSPYLNLDTGVLSREVMEGVLASPAELPHETPSEATAVTPPATSTLSLSAAQTHFRGVLKQLIDMSFLVTDPAMLEGQSFHLEKLLQEMRDCVPTEHGLHLHQGTAVQNRPRRSLPTRHKRKKKAGGKQGCKTVQHPRPCLQPLRARPPTAARQGQQRVTASSSSVQSPKPLRARPPTAARQGQQRVTASSSSVQSPKPLRARPPTAARQGQQRVTSSSSSVQSPISVNVQTNDTLLASAMSIQDTVVLIQPGKQYRIHGVTLSSTNLLTLCYPQWIDDKVIDSFFRRLQVEQNAGSSERLFSFPATTSSLWEHEAYRDTFYPEVNFSAVRWTFVPLLVRSSHWVLLVCDGTAHTVSVLDSKHSQVDEAYCLQEWGKFNHARCSALGIQPAHWKRGNEVSGNQTDGSSCGAFVLMNAYALLQGWDLRKLSQENAKAFRKFVLADLLRAESKSSSQSEQACDMPGCQSLSDSRVPCCICWRWTHWQSCAGLPDKPGQEYKCVTCVAHFS